MMNNKILFFILFFIPGFFTQFIFANESSTLSQISISSAVEISPRQKITFFDLVESNNLSESLIEEFKKIVVADDKTKTLSRSFLIDRLKGLKAKFKIPEVVKILRSNSAISRLELERKIRNHLSMKCASCEYKVQINSVPKLTDPNWALDLNINFDKATVLIPLFSKETSALKSWVTAEVIKYKSLPVLNRSIRIGETLKLEFFNFEKRALKPYQEIIDDPQSIIGFQAARYLSEGQTLTYQDIKKEIIVKKGQLVKALYGESDFEVSISAQAEESGSLGDVVKFKNMDSNKFFTAKIIDRGLVRIE